MMSCFRACVRLSPRALVLSCSHAFMLSGSSALMPSCYRSPTLSYRRGSGHALVFLLDFAYLLVCSDSLPAPSSIPRESIRSLGNSLPVLARTGFQNRAPTEAKCSFLRSKGSPEPRTSPRVPEEPPIPIQEVSKIVFSPRRGVHF